MANLWRTWGQRSGARFEAYIEALMKYHRPCRPAGPLRDYCVGADGTR